MKTVCAFDTSGAVSPSMFFDWKKRANALKLLSDEVIYVTFDVEVWEATNNPNRIRMAGGGGTDFDCVMRFANFHCADRVVIFTDGEAPAPTVPFKGEVLWPEGSPLSNCHPNYIRELKALQGKSE